MPEDQRFPYVEIDSSLGAASALPYAPITLELDGNTADVSALVDSGAALSVLPYDVGVQLGAIWAEQPISIQLVGNLADFDARAILVSATIGQFASVRLAFAWTRNNQVPVILGQVNFFMEFDVCFFRSQLAFELKPKQSNGNY
ncbi:MAG: retroviral-like aspartic protease [Gammaproteobacteria bacterium]|nr:retroviral-like aspartic protease [Gammaproteobacteria bacterium]